MKRNVGNKIKMQRAAWNFSGSVAKYFDAHIKKSVPLYQWSHKLGLILSDFFVKKNSNIYDLGCSTGVFLNEISKYHKSKNVNLYGIDEIGQMINYSKKKYKNKNLKFIKKDILKLKFKKSDLVTSFYTIQFMNASKRQTIFNKIYKSLNWGGAFIFFEKVRAPDARFQDIMTQAYTEFKLENNFTPSEIIQKSISLKGVLDPFSTKENLLFLKRAGFKDYMTIFKYINFEGFIAIK